MEPATEDGRPWYLHARVWAEADGSEAAKAMRPPQQAAPTGLKIGFAAKASIFPGSPLILDGFPATPEESAVPSVSVVTLVRKLHTAPTVLRPRPSMSSHWVSLDERANQPDESVEGGVRTC